MKCKLLGQICALAARGWQGCAFGCPPWLREAALSQDLRASILSGERLQGDPVLCPWQQTMCANSRKLLSKPIFNDDNPGALPYSGNYSSIDVSFAWDFYGLFFIYIEISYFFSIYAQKVYGRNHPFYLRLTSGRYSLRSSEGICLVLFPPQNWSNRKLTS